MSTFHQEAMSNASMRGKASKPVKTRRSWLLRKEEVLLVALKELVVQGWKSDNGFRAGYLAKQEEAIKNSFPGTDLNGMPHIHSKISIWKKNYNSLIFMLGKSGVGFNIDGKYMIDCDPELWEQIVKCDPNAGSMLTKSWPHLEDWKEIFGKDRATGIEAEDVTDAVHDMNHVDNADIEGAHGYYHPHFETEAENDVPDDSVTQPVKEGGSARATGRKRKANEAFDGLFQMWGEISKKADDRMVQLVSRIGYEQDLAKAKKEVFGQLNKLDTLPIGEKFDACEKLAGDKQGLELFMGLSDDAKPHYILRIVLSMKL